MSAQLPIDQRVCDLRDLLDQMKLARREIEKGFNGDALRRICIVLDRLILDALRYGKNEQERPFNGAQKGSTP